jgi:hypothetical protein
VTPASDTLIVWVRGRPHVLHKRDVGPELPADRERREGIRRELERQPIAQALGLSAERPVTIHRFGTS